MTRESEPIITYYCPELQIAFETANTESIYSQQGYVTRCLAKEAFPLSIL